jgi:putative spermidine/putrescine transport system ATP-binding protein
VRILEPDESADGMHTETGRIRDVAYAGMITRYLVVLDEGGELQVVRQNLETTYAEAVEQVGRHVVVGWRPEHTVAVTAAADTTQRGDE